MSAKKIVFVLLVAALAMGQTAPQTTLPAAPAKVTVTEVAPPSMTAGGPPVILHLAGTGFQPRLTVAFSGTGVQGVVVSTTPTLITAQVTAGADAQAGPRVITVTNPDQTSNTGQAPPAFFTIAAAPKTAVAVRSVTPSAMIIGGPPATLTVAGEGFQPNAKLQIDGVNATVTAVQPSSVTATASSPIGTQPGPRNVIVVNPDQSSNKSQVPAVQFTLQPPQPKNPTVETFAPATVEAGASNVMFKIVGANFQPGAQVQVQSAGISLANVTVVNANMIAGLMSVAATEPLGPKPVTVTNPGGGSSAPGPHVTVVAPLPAATVPSTTPPTTAPPTAPPPTAPPATPPPTAPPTAPPAAAPPPQVRSVTPASLQIGDPPVALTVSGANFQPGAKLQISNVSAGIISVQPGTIMATASAAPGAQPGPQNVIVINPDQSSNVSQQPPVQIALLAPKPPPQPKNPTIETVTPATVEVGASNVMFKIVGANFEPGAQVHVASISMSLANVTVINANTIAGLMSVGAIEGLGPKPITVTNPSGGSSAPGPHVTVVSPQPPPTAPPPAAPPPAAPPPTAPPPTAPPPTAPPPTAPPPTAPPPTAPPPTQPPPTQPPPTAPPPTQPPPPPAPPQPPAAPPIVQPIKPAPKPPSESVKGPRIDVVDPSELLPGKQYKLQLKGKNLSSKTTLSFGNGVTIIGVPFFTSPADGSVQVDIAPAATPGARTAVASDPTGTNSGPGGVLIVAPGKKGKEPVSPIATPVIPKPKFHQPKGEIILDTPCDPDIGGSSQCKQPPGLDQSTPFSWHEKNPNIAKFFVYEILDEDAKVLFSAQTTNKYFHLSAANLASLPKIEGSTERVVTGGVKTGDTKAAASALPPASGGVSASTKAKAGSAPSKLGVVPPVKPGDVKGMDAAMKSGGAYAVVSGPERAQLSGRKAVTGEVYWRVSGFAAKIDEYTGKKTSEMISVESSAQRPIVLPLPPNGFSCDAGTPGSDLGTPLPLKAAYFFPKTPKPCGEKSTNICSAATFAEFPSSASVNLTRIPFPIRMIGDSTSGEVVFQNVFVDWGDGTEPQPLKVKGKFTKNLHTVWLVSPGADDNKRLRHLYLNSDKDAEYVTYKVRVFSLADPDKTPPSSVSYVSAGESVSSGSIMSAALGPASSSPAAQAKLPASASSASMPQGAAPQTGMAKAQDASAMKATLSPNMFTIACTDVRVYNPWGEGADDPLHLLAAAIVFPTDSDETKQIIRSSHGQASPMMTTIAQGAAPASAGPKGASPAPSSPKGASPASPSAMPKGTSPSSATPKGTSPASARDSGPASMSKAPPKIETGYISPVPEISDCSSAFKAAAQITYYGHGRVRLYWYVDGVLVETTEPPTELPPVSKADGEAGKKQQLIVMMSALPAALQNPPHKIELRAEGGVKPAPPGVKAVGPSPAYTIGPSQHSGSQVGQTFTVPGGPVMLPPGAKPPGGGAHLSREGGPLEDPEFEPDPIEGGPAATSTNSSSGVAVQTSLPKMSQAGPSSTFLQFPPGTFDPYTEAKAPQRYYQVIDHKIKGWPCALRFPTLNAGTFEISDLSAFSAAGTGDAATYAGTGLLKLNLPSYDPDVNSVQPVSVSFSGWKLAPTQEGNEDVLDVKSGSLAQKVDASLTAANFPMSIKNVSLTSSDCTIDGSVGVNSSMGFQNETADKLPKWAFTANRLTADGDFTFTSSTPVSSTLGASQFTMSITAATVDFSRSSGDGPTQSCTPVPDAKKWQGILISGVMSAPDTIQFNKVKLLKDYPFDKWGVEPTGLSASFSDPGYAKQVATSGVKVQASGFKFSTCSGSLNASFGVVVKNPPMVVQDISGKISVDQFANMLPSFPGVSINKDWGIVKAHITHAQLAYDNDVGNWAIAVNSHVKYVLPSTGKTVYEHDYDGIQITLDGILYSSSGTNWFPVSSAGTANISGYPLEVTALGVGTADGGGIWFGFKGDLTVGDNAPVAHDRETKFFITKTTVARTRTINPDYQLASFPAPYSPSDDGFDYSSSEKDGVKIQDVHLDFDFPPGSKTVHISADCHWEQSETAFRFVGQGSAQVADSISIDVGVIYGRVVDESYWIVKASVTMPAPITLGSSGFALFAIGGGLGYNISPASYDLGDFTKVTLDHKKDYSFSAAVDVGTVDNGFTIYGRGRLTIVIGPDAGARIDIKLWLLTTTHVDPPLAEACIQYVGGNFDAGVTLHLSVMDGLITLDAPKTGDDVCTQSAVSIHFGGADWHVWIGTIANPVTGHILVVDGSAYFMIDKDGFRTGLKLTAHFSWEGSGGGFGAYAGFDGGVEVKVNITWTPFHVFGSVHGWVDGEAGVIVFGEKIGISFGIDFMISMSAMPIEVCGSLDVYLDLPWPIPNINLSVGPVCLGG